MSLELDTRNIQINEPLKAANVRTIVDTDIIVPDAKPDVRSILQVNAISSVTEKYVQRDNITVSGIIDYTILYSADEEKSNVKSISFRTPFSQQIELSGVENDMLSFVKADVQHIEYHIQNSRKINVKSVVCLDTNVIDSIEAPVISGITSDSSIPVKSETIKAFNLAVCSENRFEVEDILKVPGSNPSIDDILKSDIRLESGEMKTVNNKVVAKGRVIVNTLYTCDDDIYYMENEIPFTEVMDVEGISADMYSEIDYSVTGASYEPEQDENGENKGIYVKISVSSLIRAFEDTEFEVISDVYSPDYEISIARRSIKINEIVDVMSSSCTVNDVVSLNPGMPEMVKIYNFIASPFVEKTYIDGSQAVVEGYINTQLLYLSDSDESPVYCMKKNIPFVHRCAVTGNLSDADVEASVYTEHNSYNFKTSTDADVRIALKVNVNVVKEKNADVITDIKINEDSPIDKTRQPGIVIYFAEENDTLWDIAKKYHTTTEEIASVNKIDENAALKNRQQLLIPKRRVI